MSLTSFNNKRALITGIGGQDGSYLAELLLSKGYEVFGTIRTQLNPNIRSIQDLLRLSLVDLNDPFQLNQLVKEIEPDEIYHFAGASYYLYSPAEEHRVRLFNFVSTRILLEAICQYVPKCRFFFAGSSEIYGNASISPQSEETPFLPETAYAKAKLESLELIRRLRDQNQIFGCTGIFFNHESPRRGAQFVTRKITSSVARIKMGLQEKLRLGNLEVVRDWGYAPDYVRAAYMMLQADEPYDLVISTGIPHRVRQFAELAFKSVGLDYRDFVEVDMQFYREPEKFPRVGDSSKIQKLLQWFPTKSFESLISEMVRADLDRA